MILSWKCSTTRFYFSVKKFRTIYHLEIILWGAMKNDKNTLRRNVNTFYHPVLLWKKALKEEQPIHFYLNYL